MIKFVDILNAEIAKTKRTWNFTLALLLPAVITLLIFGYFARGLVKAGGSCIYSWVNYSRWFLQLYDFLYPLLAAILAFSLSNIEHRNHGFKLIFTLPADKFSIYFSKVLILIFWMFCSLLLAYSLLMLSGNALSWLFPNADFQDFQINHVIMVYFLRAFLTLICIIAIHFFLSIYWDNFIISVGSACFLVIFGMIIDNWKYSYLIPYSNMVKATNHFFMNGTEVFGREILWSIGGAMLFFTGGFFMMKRKSIK